MGLKALGELIQNKELFLFLKVSGLFMPFYRLSYIASLINNGFLEILGEKPVPFDELAKRVGVDEEHSATLEAWLQTGIRLKELELEQAGYTLKGMSRGLAHAGNDSYLAIVQEVTSLHHGLILETPQKLKRGERWTLDDQDGEVMLSASNAVRATRSSAESAASRGSANNSRKSPLSAANKICSPARPVSPYSTGAGSRSFCAVVVS